MRFLIATFEGGGHVPPALLLGKRLKERGHEVLVVSDAANRSAASASGLAFEPWRTAPNRGHAGSADDPLQDWQARWPPSIVRAICDAVITGPAERYARDTIALIDRFRPDVLLSNELLFGCMLAAEREKVPLALLSANVWCFPTKSDVPPFGPGFPPSTGRFTEGRERSARAWIARLYDVGLARLNEARASLGLAPLASTLEQLQVSDLTILATSPTFDYLAAAPAPPFFYAGPLLEEPAWVADDIDVTGDGDPLILVSFSTTYQNQRAQLSKCIKALATMPVRGLVTLGPAVEASDLPVAANVRLVAGASHERILPHCAALVCHGGHGTLVRALLHGVPVICKPMIRDQPENAARLDWHRAGIRLGPLAGMRAFRRAVDRILIDTTYRDNARRLASSLRCETDGGQRAADALCELSQRSRIRSSTSSSM